MCYNSGIEPNIMFTELFGSKSSKIASLTPDTLNQTINRMLGGNIPVYKCEHSIKLSLVTAEK